MTYAYRSGRIILGRSRERRGCVHTPALVFLFGTDIKTARNHIRGGGTRCDHTGSVTVIIVPRPGALSAAMRPP